MRAFADALDCRNATKCAELACTMLTGPKSKRGRWSMVGDETRWYLERVPQLRRGDVELTLTRVEKLEANVQYAVTWITDAPHTLRVQLSSVRDGDRPKKNNMKLKLSRAGAGFLRAALQPEYDLLEEL